MDTLYWVKSVQIWSFFWSVFSYISVISGIQSEYSKIRTRKNSVFEHFSRSVKGQESNLNPSLADNSIGHQE